MDLDSVADELYGLPLSDFTAARNARAKEARADGDRDLSDEIKGLGKPTTSAWLVNQLARELDDELEPLIELGRELREATSNLSGDELRELTHQRHRVVHALVQQARRLGSRHGTRVSDTVATEVRQTLDASLADPGVAEAVLAGRLTEHVEYAGFGDPAGVSWSGQPRPAKRPSKKPAKGGDAKGGDAKVADLAARRRESAERDVADATDRLRAAESAHEDAVRDGEAAATGLEEREATVERLRAELDDAVQDAKTARKEERAARDGVSRAEEALRRAEKAHQQAVDRLDALEE